MIDPQSLTIKKLVDRLYKREISAVEVTETYLSTIAERDKDIGAYLSTEKESALGTAARIDMDLRDGREIGLMAGVPMAIKDNLLIKGRLATAGSQILKNYIASYDASVIRKLGVGGAIFLGKTNMDEFAMGSSTENSSFKPTKNPQDLERVPGGSSGGSAAAVAGDMALAALGSDTGGSIRQPASLCGVVGLKPTYGAVSRYGLIAMASSLDQIGPFTKTVEDAAIVFNAIAGHDPMDSTSNPFVSYGSDLLTPDFNKVKDLTIGIPEEYFGEGLDGEVASSMTSVISFFRSKGFKIKQVNMPHTRYGLSVYYIVMPAEASTNLARYEGVRYGVRGDAGSLKEIYFRNRGEGFGPEVKRRIVLGTFVLSAGYYDAYYLKAQKVRALVKHDFEEAFERVDVLLTPTAPTVAFKLGEKTQSPLEMYMSDILTIPANLAGIPAVSIPVRGREGKLPVGFQLMGRPWREADILGLGMYYEKN
ncbi:MAG: Asp-tRNA(Asn)/Glu-tRNA(Gln) amidotransferase subunit GatA [Candidatus Colwellbacteria bacterium]|nr:Asp-tRNA(Asn)/Glu-tRNA(Gln) amidotransferase subunit GatA [Candidatus Colwellbacteria bacterium]